ncbi:hypothetical protein O206_11155 [Ochrobactrum sp. EGD-AQ16]|nr:hypothetical protein O206_11155 [Ochrobactrum sp. EGD-AQ16]
MKKIVMSTALILSAFYIEQANAQSLEYCYAPQGSKTYLQKTIGSWKILKSKCSCSATTVGKPTSLMFVHAIKSTPEQAEPNLMVLVFLDKKMKSPQKNIVVKADGFELETETEGEKDFIASTNWKADIIETISSSSLLEVGPYRYSLKQSTAALKAMLACYSTLPGK